MGCKLSRLFNQGRKYLVAEGTPPVEALVAAGEPPEAQGRKRGPHAAPGPAGGNAAAAKEKLDPRDFTFTNLMGETRVKLPGEINGQPFVIENCKDCDLYLLDHCAMVTIDDCTGCRIFVGPTDSSIFIRTSSNCRCAFLCRQLRTRDCTGCALLLLCRTRPVLESSRAMSLSCYALPYPGLREQLAACRLSVFHNFWSDVHDFTPAEPGAACNHALAPPPACLGSFMGTRLPDGVSQLFPAGPAAVATTTTVATTATTTTTTTSSSGAAGDAGAGTAAAAPGAGGAPTSPAAPADPASSSTGLLPLWGSHPLPDSGAALPRHFVLFPPSAADAAVAALLVAHCCSPAASPPPAALKGAGGGGGQGGGCLLLLRANQATLGAGDVQHMAHAAGWSAADVKGLAGAAPCIGVELAGQGDALQQLVAAAAAASKGAALVTPSGEAAAHFRFLGITG